MTHSFRRVCFLLLPLVLLYWAIPFKDASTNLLDFLNATLPLCFVAVTALLSLQVVVTVNGAVWTPLVWFPVQSMIFFGFGPLVEVFGSTLAQDILDSHYLAISEQELFRAYKLSITGVFLVLLGMLFHMEIAPRKWRAPDPSSTFVVDPFQLGVTFVILGAAFKYLLLKPVQWGMLNFLIPGVVSNLSNIVDIGTAILAFSAARGNKLATLILVIFLPVHMILSMISLSKLELIIAILLPVIGAYLGRANPRRFAIRVVFMVMVFAFMQPFTSHGRHIVLQNTGTIDLANYSERLTILSDYIFDLGATTYSAEEESEQRWWMRLNFAGAQSRALELYDRGFANPQIGDAWMYFIPRAIWPGKPILYSPGLFLYRALVDNDEGASNLGLSIYGDLYWQYGWLGVLVGCPLIGIVIAILSSVSLKAVLTRNFLLMPFVLMVLQIGLLAPNKFVINGIIGPIPILIFYYFVCQGGLAMLRKLNPPQASQREVSSDLSKTITTAGS